jgi:hypothetical protein
MILENVTGEYIFLQNIFQFKILHSKWTRGAESVLNL